MVSVLLWSDFELFVLGVANRRFKDFSSGLPHRHLRHFMSIHDLLFEAQFGPDYNPASLFGTLVLCEWTSHLMCGCRDGN